MEINTLNGFQNALLCALGPNCTLLVELAILFVMQRLHKGGC